MTESKPWDYIIAGGGIAGCVVASRLKHYQPSSRILLIEAGGWTRGAKADYDGWAEIVNDQRWSYEGQLPYFKMTERWFSDNPEALNSHGRDGTLQIESPTYTNRIYPLTKITEEAWAEIGVNKLPGADMNAGTNLGLGELNENRSNGARQIAPLVYPLDGITVQTDTLVQSIVLDGSRATGILLADGTEISSQEVIVAAGAYRTPQLLMLSGIGPRETLEKHGIEVKIGNPDVGKNFNDHVKVHLNWRLKDPSKGYAAAIAKDEGENAVTPEHYLLKRDRALMETLVMYLGTPPVAVDGTHISSALIALKPTSRGTVTITSKDPKDAPLLDPNYFATEVDKAVWRHSLRRITELMSGDPSHSSV
ncbi:hypothetical protein F4823DRAFT_568797 [Ustulina deusta]|nr:hypothetical protein F4823DRAFT_568797 [Ustulina deusta]